MSQPFNFNSYLSAMRAHALAQRIPVISQANAAFVCRLLTQRRPMRMLEIGTATGVSGAGMANCLAAWAGVLTTLEISVPTQSAAQTNFQTLGLSNVRSHCGDARALLKDWHLAGVAPFDCAFIDAQKSQTHVFYEAALTVLAHGGLMIVDDVWRYRSKMPAFYALLAEKKQSYSLHFVDGADATMVLEP